MREQIYLDTIKDHHRDDVLAEEYFFLNDWDIETIDFGNHVNDREVIRHAVLNFDKYYHIIKFPDHVFMDRELMVEYVMSNDFVQGGLLIDEAVPKLKEFQDTPEFFKAIFDQYIADLESYLIEYLVPPMLLGNRSFPVTTVEDFGFTGHRTHSAIFLEKFAKIMGDCLIENKDTWCLSCSDDRIEWRVIKNYIASRDAISEAGELEAFIDSSSPAKKSKGGRL